MQCSSCITHASFSTNQSSEHFAMISALDTSLHWSRWNLTRYLSAFVGLFTDQEFGEMVDLITTVPGRKPLWTRENLSKYLLGQVSISPGLSSQALRVDFNLVGDRYVQNIFFVFNFASRTYFVFFLVLSLHCFLHTRAVFDPFGDYVPNINVLHQNC